MRRLAIVIPVYNRLAVTRTCLKALSVQTVPADLVIVVDDGSSDGTEEMIRTEFPEVVVLRGDGNLWWTGATNLGIKLALELRASHILTLNDDTLPEPRFIEKMLAAADQKHGALIGAYAIDAATGRPVFGGARMNWFTASGEDLLSRSENTRTGLVETTHYPGRGLLIPAQVFRRIGLFDADHFPHYLADYDFTHRARRNGFPVFCNYSAPLGIYPEASGDAEIRRNKGLRNYYRHLFHIKGAANLRAFFWLVVRNCPPALVPVCLPVGFVRRVVGYPMDWFIDSCTFWWRRHGLHRA